jgi:hypothetical protein
VPKEEFERKQERIASKINRKDQRMQEVTGTPEDLGPYLNAAFICEKALREQDGVVSAIRMVDRITRVGPNEVMDPFEYHFVLLLNFKSGQALGTYKISIQPIKPGTNEKLPAAVYSVNFEPPEDRGVGLCADMRVEFDVQGLWWFDIYLSGERRERRVSRIPFRIIYLPQPEQKSG